MNPIVINLNNLRSDNVYVLLTDDNSTASTANVTGITVNTPTSITAITNNQIAVSNISGGRLYFVKGDFTGVPLPNLANQYYGWIEFSQMPSDCPMTQGSICQYWVNLSNVDITGMQIAMSGTDINNNTFSVGYLSAATDVINVLANKFPNAVVGNGDTKKILAPNHLPTAYPSYSSYFNSLTATTAGMVIISDDNITFTGTFCNYVDNALSAYTSSPVVVLLTDVNGNTFKLTAEDLTDDIIYECDGGHVYYNNTQYPQNRGGKGGTVVTTNSTFREIMLGFNEGYFTPSETVSNCNFAMMVPFTNGGNQYAQVIHGLSNSYGFPYADSNLKVLLTALAGESYPLTVTICNDSQPMGYSESKSTNNMPSCGINTLGVGPDSPLGVIVIGQCTYSIDENTGGTYGGFLPTFTGWTQVHFNGPAGPYIWANETTQKVINVDANSNLIVSSINGPIGWNKAASGQLCLTFPDGTNINTSAGPCINPPSPPVNWFKMLMVKIIEWIIFWNNGQGGLGFIK